MQTFPKSFSSFKISLSLFLSLSLSLSLSLRLSLYLSLSHIKELFQHLTTKDSDLNGPQKFLFLNRNVEIIWSIQQSNIGNILLKMMNWICSYNLSQRLSHQNGRCLCIKNSVYFLPSKIPFVNESRSKNGKSSLFDNDQQTYC